MKNKYIIFIFAALAAPFLNIYCMNNHIIEHTSDPVKIFDHDIPTLAKREAIQAEQEAISSKKTLHAYIDKKKYDLSELTHQVLLEKQYQALKKPRAQQASSYEDEDPTIETAQEKLTRLNYEDEDPTIETAQEKLTRLNKELETLKTSALKKALIAKNKQRIYLLKETLKKNYSELDKAYMHLKKLIGIQSPEYDAAEQDVAKKESIVENNSKLLLTLQNKDQALLHQPIDSIELSELDKKTIASVLQPENGFKT